MENQGSQEIFIVFINKTEVGTTYYYVPGRRLSPSYLLPHLILMILPHFTDEETSLQRKSNLFKVSQVKSGFESRLSNSRVLLLLFVYARGKKSLVTIQNYLNLKMSSHMRFRPLVYATMYFYQNLDCELLWGKEFMQFYLLTSRAQHTVCTQYMFVD